jgi:hypothetical protein
MRYHFLAFALIAVFHCSAAFAGKEAGNGGDICEDRIKVIRTDIRDWIAKGGSEKLALPTGIPLRYYDARMTELISKAIVSCTDQTVAIGRSEKVCKNFQDESGSLRILCNANRFMSTNEDDQYVLVHHEYAGLAGFESNTGEESQYEISNQISGFLEYQVVKKLVVKDPSPVLPQCRFINHSNPVSNGTKCITTNGAVWERVIRPNLGEAWRGPDGVVWGPQVGDQENFADATEYCQLIGGILPSRTNFIRGHANDMEEVLPNWKSGKGIQYWTSTLYELDDGQAYSVSTDGWIIGPDPRNQWLYNHVRCVSRW